MFVRKTNVMQYIYKNIVLARESRGLTQSNLAKAIDGLTQGNLSRMEKGLLAINDDVIQKIAAELNYPITFFEKRYDEASDSSLFYRKRISMPRKQLSELEANINIRSRVIDELLDSIDIPEFKIPHISATENLEPKEIAHRLRNYLGISSGPIENLVTLLEKYGVIVIFYNFDFDKFDGVTKFTASSQPVIWINKNIPNDRKRFTLAHELGHLVMHLRSTSIDIEDQEMENQANEFASEFMMPYVECKKDLFRLKFQDLPSLKYYWKISKAAILYRAKDIGAINENTYVYYNITLGRLGERKQEKELIDIDQPSIVKKMLDLHTSELGYDQKELSVLLGVPIPDLLDLWDMVTLKPKLRVI